MIDNGADIGAVDEWGRTALSMAKDRKYNEIVELIKQKRKQALNKKFNDVLGNLFGVKKNR